MPPEHPENQLAQRKGRPLNILLVFLEDQGYQLSLAGTPGLSTPHLDALARSGTLYRKAYVTLATCTGSKSPIYTGLHNATIGATSNVQDFIGPAEALQALSPEWLNDPQSAYNLYRIREHYPTVVELLRAAGYFTGLQNKLHVAPHSKFPFDRWYRPPPNDRPTDYQQVRDFVADADEIGRNWFLVHIIPDPHRPFPNADTEVLDINAAATQLPGHLVDAPPVRQDWSEYLQGIQNADARLGMVMQALEDAGVRDDTLVIVLGDHGPSYHRGKWSTYDLGLHVPLIFSGPDVLEGVQTDAVFSGVDMLPTVLDYLELPPLADSHGVSHRALLKSGAGKPREYALGVARTDRSITDGEYRLIFIPNPDSTEMPADNREFEVWRNRVYSHILANASTPGYEAAYRFLDLADRQLKQYGRPRFEFFHTEQDPWETSDLYGKPEHRQAFDRLLGVMREMLDQIDDPGQRP